VSLIQSKLDDLRGASVISEQIVILVHNQRDDDDEMWKSSAVEAVNA
jgi:hypothetical protein